VRARGVVVGEVRAQQAAEMTLIEDEDEDVVQAFAADRADQALGEGILPGGARGDQDLADAHVCDSASELVTIDRVPIAAHVLGDRELSHIVAEEPKLGLDAATAPGGILASHAANQVPDLAIDRRAPGSPSS